MSLPGEFFHDDGSVPYRHCPRCGGRLEERVVLPHDPPRKVCGACGFVFYLDPKVAAGAICRTPEGIVLLRRNMEPGHGLWVYPGGYVDRGEPLEAAAARETREEVGIDVRIDHLVGVYSYPGRPVIVVVYAATAIGGDLRGGPEALEVGAFERSAIPWDALAFQSTREALRDYFNEHDRRT
ncbi:MAG TPA: NUDIX hydrolase [Candidatus Polarisedimenticolia bacterium]|nr:NUDIX hydrolase [Candidatus Polarisedimenticolia bacterium]